MLKNIILIFTGTYIRKIKELSEWNILKGELEKQNYKVHLTGMECVEDIGDRFCMQESIFISDDRAVLEHLRKLGGYTMACYHEGVSGLMGCTQYAIEGIEGMDADYLEKVYQRYCKIPWHITETKRCSIREMGPADLADLYELYADKRITRYTEALFEDREHEKNYIEDYVDNVYKYFGFGTWLIHRKKDGRLIGRAGFNYRAGFDEPELGFVIGYPYWRQGYAYEVCIRLLQIGRTVFEFEKIQALVDEENEASKCLLKKLGFCYVEKVVVDGKEYCRYLYR